MKKKKIEMQDLGKINFRNNLKRIFPFLAFEYRQLKENELKNEKVLKELFGENENDLHKLEVVYKYQQ